MASAAAALEKDALAAANAAPAAEPAGAAAPGSPEDDNKKAKKTAVTSTEKAVAQLRSERLEQRRKLSQIRKDIRTAKRKASALNKKASKITMEELLQISLLKYRSLAAAGEVDDTEEIIQEASSSSTGDGLPEKAFGIMAAMASKKHKPAEE
jgi:hypothetical protein